MNSTDIDSLTVVNGEQNKDNGLNRGTVAVLPDKESGALETIQDGAAVGEDPHAVMKKLAGTDDETAKAARDLENASGEQAAQPDQSAQPDQPPVSDQLPTPAQPDQILRTDGSITNTESTTTPQVEHPHSKESFEAERKFVGSFVADLIQSESKKQNKAVTAGEVVLLKKMKAGEGLTEAETTGIREIINRLSSGLDFPPNQYFNSFKEGKNITEGKNEYIGKQLSTLLENYYGKKPQTKEGKQVYKLTEQDEKELKVAAESVGMLTVTENGNLVEQFASIAEQMGGGAVSYEDALKALNKSGKFSEDERKLIVSPADLSELGAVITGLFSEEKFNQARIQPFREQPGVVNKLKETFKLKWTEMAIEKHRDELKKLEKERAEHISIIKTQHQSLAALGPSVAVSQKNVFEAHIKQETIRVTSINVQIQAVTANIAMLQEGRKSREKSKIFFNAVSNSYGAVPAGSPEQQAQWFQLLGTLRGSEFTLDNAAEQLKVKPQIANVGEKGTREEFFEKARHNALKLGGGLTAIMIIMIAMQVMQGVQTEASHQ